MHHGHGHDCAREHPYAALMARIVGDAIQTEIMQLLAGAAAPSEFAPRVATSVMVRMLAAARNEPGWLAAFEEGLSREYATARNLALEQVEREEADATAKR